MCRRARKLPPPESPIQENAEGCCGNPPRTIEPGRGPRHHQVGVGHRGGRPVGTVETRRRGCQRSDPCADVGAFLGRGATVARAWWGARCCGAGCLAGCEVACHCDLRRLGLASALRWCAEPVALPLRVVGGWCGRRGQAPRARCGGLVRYRRRRLPPRGPTPPWWCRGPLPSSIGGGWLPQHPSTFSWLAAFHGSPGTGAGGAADRPRRGRLRPRLGYTPETMVMPPRDFCRSVTCTLSAASSSAAATSSRIRTVSASQNWPSLRNCIR